MNISQKLFNNKGKKQKSKKLMDIKRKKEWTYHSENNRYDSKPKTKNK